MATDTAAHNFNPPAHDPVESLPLELHSGDRMNREEFHYIYSRMPENFRAELIDGVVYVASPAKYNHGRPITFLSALLLEYEATTPGCEVNENVTVLLDDGTEVQPDILLRICEGFGGQSRLTEDDYIDGGPEFVIEVANTTRSIDLNNKKAKYRENGVREYVVYEPTRNVFHWFDLSADKQLTLPKDNIARSIAFPGLWIDVEAVATKSLGKAKATLEAGLKTTEYATFKEQLAAAKKPGDA
ncbi:Uma2 family endonuclease [Stratiformator vulcanicus]|uniref:Putative restriction endonuclease domain-containing protein n=1 Tax=Stratiformator vulcanicus TaxID=2527980 RepID=A0A517R6E5_9PLAN|nr:Uma2 family endonuclease [Stratiformator vulcanicus]QDT39464.1 hypothetical protein Pan189_38720 [Stratiformator vulcanicus]